MKITGYCYRSVNVITFSLAQSDHIKRLLLQYSNILGFGDQKKVPATQKWVATNLFRTTDLLISGSEQVGLIKGLIKTIGHSYQPPADECGRPRLVPLRPGISFKISTKSYSVLKKSKKHSSLMEQSRFLELSLEKWRHLAFVNSGVLRPHVLDVKLKVLVVRPVNLKPRLNQFKFSTLTVLLLYINLTLPNLPNLA